MMQRAKEKKMKDKVVKEKKRLSKEKIADSKKPAEKGNEAAELDESSEEEREEGGIEVGGVYVPPAPPAVCSNEVTGPRLIITHIVNENFKSYQGRRVLGPFHKSFTSIIGPNGSGKSNVIDSMLFVFGYRANKIRSKKLSVLIHKSEKHQNIHSCTVAVHFALIEDLLDDDCKVVPGSQVVIARTAYADNTSKYTLNGRTATFKDVTTLLRTKGIDLKNNRFLILQGEVEQIAMMKPKAQTEHDTGMLEYLEDIIGTVRYKRPIEKLRVKVEQVVEERQEKLNRLKMVEKDRNALIEPVQDALAYLRKDNERIRNKNKYFQFLRYQLKVESKEKEEEKSKTVSLKEGGEAKLKQFAESNSFKIKELNGKQKQLEVMKSQKGKLSEQFNQSENRDTQLKEEISQTNRKRKKTVELKKQDEAKVADLKKVPEKNAKEIDELTVLKTRLSGDQEKESANVKKVLSSIAEMTKGLCEKKDLLQNKLIGLKNTRDDAKANYDIAKLELDIYLSNEKKEKDRLTQYQTSYKQASEKLDLRQREIAGLEEEVPRTERELTEAQKEAGRVRQQETAAMAELNTVRSELHEKSSSAQANASRGKVLDFIMGLKTSQQLPGVFGRLGDLGGIDSKYDVAVSTACGPLDHIVVDSVRTAKEAVEALKRGNVGRANFIALEKVNWLRNQYSKPLKTPEGVPRLFDLIKCQDERFLAAFYFGLRDTLVASNLEQAKRVAYGAKRFRVVTLDGEIIEIVGTMSGGGNYKARGRMGRNATVTVETVSPAQMKAMQLRLKELEVTVEELRDQRVRLEDVIVSKSRQLNKIKNDLRSFSSQVKELRKEEAVLSQQMKEQEVVAKNCTSDPARVKQLQSKVDSLQTDLDDASEKVDGMECEMQTINKEIEAATGGKVQTAQKKLDAVKKQLEKVTKDISRLTAGIKTSQRELKKAEDRIQSAAVEINEAEEALKKCQSEREKLQKDAEQLLEKLQKIDEDILDSEESVKKLRQEVSSTSKEENKIKAELLSINQQIEMHTKEIQQIESKCASLQQKLKELKLHEIPLMDDEEPQEEDTEELRVFPEEELALFKGATLKYRETTLDTELQSMKYNPHILNDYRAKVALCKERMAELEEVTQRRNELRNFHDELRKCRLREFMHGFTVISNKLKEMYQMITFGGDAEFELADNLDPFSEGVVFSVRPPKKSWKIISNLSGGEKTLSSLALVFALHYYKPSPLYVMDEIDAALDFKNVSIVGHYIKERTKNSQFIIISLRSNMYELADVLVGIYKTHNCTKSVTVTPKVYSSPRTQGEKRKQEEDQPQQANKMIKS